MKKEQNQVREFMKLANQETPDRPTMIGHNGQTFRCNLIFEELSEYEHAENEVEVADAIADLLYVVLGTAVAHGIDIEPVFAEVHRSNMSKFIDGHRREDGKWMRGPAYSPANIAPILEAQNKSAAAAHV